MSTAALHSRTRTLHDIFNSWRNELNRNCFKINNELTDESQ